MDTGRPCPNYGKATQLMNELIAGKEQITPETAIGWLRLLVTMTLSTG